jgi:hypothetical protein
MTRSIAVGSLLSLLSLAAAACSGNTGSTGGGGTPPAPTSTSDQTQNVPGIVMQHGTIIDFGSNKPIAGATVTANDATATTDAKGNYQLPVHQGEAFEMSVSAPGYAGLMEQQTALADDYDRGKTTIVPMNLATLLKNTFDGYDATLGILSVGVLTTASCASAEGAKITVSGQEGAQLKYFVSGLPAGDRETVKAGEFPSAVIYNLTPNVPVSISITHPTCKQAAFPFTITSDTVVLDPKAGTPLPAGITFMSMVVTEPGDVTSYQRLFLQ